VAFTPMTPLVFYRARQPLAVHVVFSLHFFAFLMLLICCLLPAAILALALGVSGRSGGALDAGLAYVILGFTGTYFYAAVSRVFGVGGMTRFLSAGALTAASTVIFYAYRFAVFVITLHTT
jgi:hypothetical protein